ncbi:MAG: hypothetical protein Q8O11_02785, partial [Syntrophales bacterium]|nr:hypothetical protein [Syntrophales bacterium]
GYRANVVAYTIAKLALLIRTAAKDKVLDFRTIWNQQRISQAMERQLEQIAEAVFNTIVAENRPVDNVTEWCKKKLCWERVECLKIALFPAFNADLVDRIELLAAKKDAKDRHWNCRADRSCSAWCQVLATTYILG